jgi:hypothetical protein
VTGCFFFDICDKPRKEIVWLDEEKLNDAGFVPVVVEEGGESKRPQIFTIQIALF